MTLHVPRRTLPRRQRSRNESKMSREVNFVQFSNDGCFWASFQAHEVLQRIESHTAVCVCSGSLHPASVQLSTGEFCAVPYANNLWSRAQICSLLTSGTMGTQVELFLIDRGVTVTIPSHRLYSLPAELASYPPLVQKFSLKGIIPHLPAQMRLSWAEAAERLFRKITRSSTNSWVETIADIGSDNSAVLYCQAGDIQINVNECLVAADLAILDASITALGTETGKMDSPEAEGVTCLGDALSTFENQQRATIQQFHPCPPPKYHGVCVSLQVQPINSLALSGFLPTVCKELATLGFQNPTAVQAYGWPLLSEGHSTLLVSPPSTGKTLAYLLPLLSLITSPEYTYHDGGTLVQRGPLLVVLVATSSQARSVHHQARRILSWINITKKFRCCCAYNGAEVQAIHQLINGVDVMVCTPPSLLRLVKKDVTSLDSLRHWVFDDVSILLERYSTEVETIMAAYTRRNSPPQQVVMVTSVWSDAVDKLRSGLKQEMVTVIACAIEVAVKASVDMRVLPCQTEDEESLLLQCVGEGTELVCTSTPQEAVGVYQVLQLHSWPAICIVKGTSLRHVLSKPAVIVISDDVLPLDDEESLYVRSILHHGLPLRKADFRHRLALLYPAIVKGESCTSTVVLTEKCREQSLLVKKLLQRMHKTVSPSVEMIVAEALKDREERQQNYDLCYYLKAWGYCGLERCNSPHQLMTPTAIRPQLLQLPEDGSVKVKVVHLSNATRLWVTLLQHSPLHRGRKAVPCHDPAMVLKLSTQLAHYYAQSENKKLHESPSEGDYCGYQHEEGGYYRVRVLKFSQPLGFYFHHKEQARVRLIDVGCVHVVDVNQLLSLPERFLLVSSQVVEVFICGLRPLDSDMDWPEEAVYYMRRLLEGKVLHGRVALSCGQTLWLDPIEHRVSLEGIGVTTALVSPQQELIKAGLAEANPDHLKLVSETLGVAVQKQAVNVNLSSYAHLALNISVEVTVTAVASPKLFYVQLVEVEGSLEAMEYELNVAQTPSMSADGVDIGSCCVAQYPLDNRWYRGLVLSVDGHQAEVFFVDYGNTEWVGNNHVQPMDSAYMHVPFQAIECSLGVENVEWCSEAENLLWEWTKDQVFLAKAVDSRASEVPEMPDMIQYIIELYDGGGTNMANRLPRLKGSLEHTSSTKQESASVLGMWLSQLSLAISENDQVLIAKKVLYLVVLKPSVPVMHHDLQTTCELLSVVPDSVRVSLLKILCGIAAFQHHICENLVEVGSLKHILPLLKDGTVEVVEQVLVLVKMVLPQPGCLGLLSSREFTTALIGCLGGRSNQKVVGHALDILAAMVAEDRKLSEHFIKGDTVERICRVFMQSPPLHMPCLTILHSLVSARHGLAMTSVKQLLPISTTLKLLASQQKPEMIHLIVEIFQKLCVDPAFRHKLSASPFIKNIQKSGNTAVNCLLIGELCSTLDIHQTWARNGSSSPEDLPPPLMDVASQPPSSLTVQQPQQAYSASMHGLTEQKQMRFNVNDIHTQPSSLHPRVLWSQSSSHVLLAVQLRGCAHKEVDLNPHSVHFQSMVKGQNYAFRITLFAEIIPKASSEKVTGSEIVIKLIKKETVNWSRLTKQSEKLPYLGVDFDRWNEDSSSDTQGKVPVSEAKKSLPEPKHKTYTSFLLPEQDTSNSEDDDRDSDDLISDTIDFSFT